MLAAVDKVDVKVDKVKAKVVEVKIEMRSQEERLTAQIDDVRASLHNHTVIQLNSLRKWLNDPIEPVSALNLTGDHPKYTVAPGFPITVREFWRLLLNRPTLIQLAQHYFIVS